MWKHICISGPSVTAAGRCREGRSAFLPRRHTKVFCSILDPNSLRILGMMVQIESLSAFCCFTPKHCGVVLTYFGFYRQTNTLIKHCQVTAAWKSCQGPASWAFFLILGVSWADAQDTYRTSALFSGLGQPYSTILCTSLHTPICQTLLSILIVAHSAENQHQASHS